jgi:two-component system, OmpR family, sensor kinase
MFSNPLSRFRGWSLARWPFAGWPFAGWHFAAWSLAGWSLRRRLLVGVLSLLAVLCLAVGVVSIVAVRQGLIGQLDRQLLAAQERAQGGPGHLPGPGPEPFPQGQGPGTIRAVLVLGTVAEAQILRPPPVPLPVETYDALRSVPADGRPHTAAVGDFGDYRLIATTYRTQTLVTGLPLAPVEETVWRLVLIEAIVAGAGLVLAGIAGALVVRISLRPLRRVVATARRVSELPLSKGDVDLSVRVPDADTDQRTEVGQVGAALNRLLGHVGDALAVRHASETRVRQFVADASHELRTPLAAIRGYAELTRRGSDRVAGDVAHALDRIESESARMTTLVDDLLLLARLDSGRPLERDPVELSGLVVDAVNDAHAAGREHRWLLDLPDAAVTVAGDGARLHQVLASLLANARIHTPPGTTVTTSLAILDGWATVTVADNGPGIPEALRPDIFERFARGDTSRSRAAGSTGLGLAIVAAVVEAHGGRVEVTSEPGQTAFEVHLPGATTRPED